MKKNLTLLIATILFIVSYNSNATPICNDVTYPEIIFKPIEVHINFTLAKPRSDCQQFPGICKAEGGVSISRYSGVSVGGNCTYENGKLYIDFLKKEMDAEMIKRFNSITIFPIDEPFVIPSKICEQLVAPPLTIPVGKYQIIRTVNGFSISINCK